MSQFRKVLSIKSDKISELAEDTCTEVLDKDFVDIFALLVKDLASSKLEAELHVEKVECNLHQGDKVGISAIGELARIKDNVIMSAFLEWADLMHKIQHIR